MRVRLATAFLGAAALLALASEARAQRGDSGSITGGVYDQTGAPIRGVRVTVFSETQIGGRKSAYTNASGEFRFPTLDPGTFEVRAEAPKLRTFVQKNINVGINAPTEINVVMEVASSEIEEVKVVQKAPLISTTTASVKEVYDVDFVDSMPHDNRDVIFQQMPNYSAGVINNRIRGGAANQTINTMDGFILYREYPTVKASAAYETMTAGYGVDNVMAPGGVVNLVSRSGSNKFELEMEGTFDNSAFRLFTDKLDSPSGSNFYIVNPTVSGPIIKDKLWYSANVEFLSQKTGRDLDPEGILPPPQTELRLWYKGTLKLTWQATSRNKVSGIFLFDRWWRWYANGLGTTQEAQVDSVSPKYFSGLIWESVLSDSAVFRSQAGLVWSNTENFPHSCGTDPAHCDSDPAYRQTYPKQLNFGNANQHDQRPGTLIQLVNRLEFFFGNKKTGEHDLQIKDNLMLLTETLYSSKPGDKLFELNGPLRSARTIYYSNDPRLENDARYGWYITAGSSLRNAATISDAWRPTRYLTITPGVAFVTGAATNGRGDQVISQNRFIPSISAAWDATRDGRTVVRGSFAEYLDTDLVPVATQSQGAQVSNRCQWDDTTGDYTKSCTWSGGASGSTVGLPCGPSGIDSSGQPCKQKLRLPQTTEWTAGAEREVVEGLALGLDFVYRKFSHQFELEETNRLWNASGSDALGVGGFRNGRSQTVSDLETPDGASRRYVGVTASATKREGRFKIGASYTWSRLDGTVLDGFNNPYGDIPARDAYYLYGPLGDDHRHEIKLNASYHVNRWLSVSSRYSYISGQPYSRFFLNPVTGAYENLAARVGYNSGAQVNDPTDDRALRLPDQQNLNAQIAFNFEPLIGTKLEAFVDWLNVLGLRTTTAVTTQDGPSFGVETGRFAPMRVRLGARYRY
jgi:hypothetical protein